jgi:hypothetical protein
MPGSNLSCQLRKPIKLFLRAAPKVHRRTLLRMAHSSSLANDMMFRYALCLSLGDARMGINAGFGLRPNRPAAQRSAIN